MNRRSVRSVALVLSLVVALTLVSGVPGMAASSSYDISLSPSVETPPRTVTFQNDNYDVSAIGRVDPGQSVTATVSAPSGDTYRLYVYDSDKQIVDSHRRTGDATVQLSTAGYPAGTYVVTVYHDGAFQKVHPLVVSDYTVSIDTSATALQDSTIQVNISTSPINGNKAISQAKIVVGNANDDVRKTFSRSSYSDFETNVSLQGLGEGDYSTYAVVQGSDEFLGNKVMLGVSDSQSLAIETPTPTPTATATPAGGNGTDTPTATETSSSEDQTEDASAGGGAAGGGPPALVSTPTDAPTESTTPVETESTAIETSASTAGPETGNSPQTPGTDLNSPEQSPETQRKSSTATSQSPTPEDVITPAPATASPAPTPTPNQSLGFSPLVIALVLFGVLALRRR